MISMKAEDEKFMREAIKICERGVNAGQAPFGAVIVKNKRIIARGHNEVWADTDITAHGEIVAIRNANRKLKSVKLKGCTIYSTTEPCPMCFSAIHWARMDRIVYGASIKDAKKAGFHELTVSNKEMKRKGGSAVEITGGVLARECRKQLKQWKLLRKCGTY
ncbi:nucleoside deaminase [Candidatus Micrarchaeota archaeon]|nr:nucleoside deaminase [Candidatus Micrarchaeota archaeon]